jgi:hypothetical protein
LASATASWSQLGPLPENAKPDPKITAQLEAVAKKNGFASYDEYNDVVANKIYSVTVCTTLLTGRVLATGSFMSLTRASSYSARVCSGALAFM